MSNNSNRVVFFDVIKAFSILLVVYCHKVLIPNDSFAGNIIMSCAWVAVPCFMMTSGALMHRTDRFSWKKYLTRLITVYLVLCAWRVIYFLVFLSMGAQMPGKIQLLNYVFFFGGIDGVNTSVMWYMTAYLINLLIYPATRFLFRSPGTLGKQITLFLMVIAGIQGIGIFSLNWLVAFLGSVTGINVPTFTGLESIFPFQYSHMIFFFLAGAFLFEYKDNILAQKKLFLWLTPLCFIISIAGLMAVKYVNVSLWTWGGSYLENGYRHLFTTIASLSVYIFFSLFEYKGLPATLGRIIGSRTLGIYYMHYIILAVCNNYLYKLIPSFLGINIVKTVVIAAVCTLLTLLLEKIPVVRKLVR